MELRHLTYFVAVAEELNFGRAARRLGIAQPPLSQQIQRLELDLGVALFDRSRRQIQLTEGGRVLLDEARSTLARAAQARDAVQRVGRGERGTLRIGFVGSAAMHDAFVRIARRYRERFPDVKLRFELLDTADTVAGLLTHRLDVGYVRPPLQTEAEQLSLVRVVREPWVILLPSDHALASSRRVLLSSLADEDFVMFPRAGAPGLYDEMLRHCRDAGFSPRVRYCAGPLQVVAGLVAAGCGVSLMPASIRQFRSEGLAYFPLGAPSPTTEIALASRRDDTSPLVTAYVEVARAICKGGRLSGCA